MLTYEAMYKLLDEGVHAEVLDFPGVIIYGKNLEETQRLLGSVDIYVRRVRNSPIHT